MSSAMSGISVIEIIIKTQLSGIVGLPCSNQYIYRPIDQINDSYVYMYVYDTTGVKASARITISNMSD